MELSSELISQFVKSTKDTKTKTNESTVYGTVVIDGKTYVRLDGSDLLTPVSMTTVAKDGERVTVLIKDHTATITGNVSSPSARNDDVTEVGKEITELDAVMAHKITTDNITAVNGYIDNLVSITGKFEELSAITAEFETIKAEFAEIDHLSANDIDALNARIDNIVSQTIDTGVLSADDIVALEAEIGSLKAYTADFTYVSAEVLTAVKADIKNLNVEKLSAEEADIKYATIDFANIGEAAIEKLFSDSGIIKDLIISEGKVTGELVGVTIKGDLIEGNTIVADKLVIKGDDGIYYALNYEGGALTGDKVADALYYEVTHNEESGEYIAGETPIKAIDGNRLDGVFTTDNREVYSFTNSDGQIIYYCVDSEWANEKLHGSVIVAKSVTANQVNVDDLVAFDATIGGFQITDDSIHSGVKESVDNQTEGVYMDDKGQFSVGDGDNHIKYYKDIDGTHKLEIAAQSLAAQIEEATVAMKTAFGNVDKHFSFTDEGLVISAGENQMSIRIDNDIVKFEKNGVLFGWWDGINFHTGNIMVEVNDRAQFGNFAFIPRSDGSLSFLKVEHNTGFYIRLASGILVIYGAYPTLEETTLLITDIKGELDDTTLILGGE